MDKIKRWHKAKVTTEMFPLKIKLDKKQTWNINSCATWST